MTEGMWSIDSASSLGSSWAAFPSVLSNGDTRGRVKWALPYLREANAVRVLDVGSRQGLLANAIALRGFRVTALSPSPTDLEHGRMGDITGAVRYLCGTPRRLPLDSASFDAILAVDHFQDIERLDLAMGEFSRLLRPGGVFLFQSCNKNFLSWLLLRKAASWIAGDDAGFGGRFIRPHALERLCHLVNMEVLSWEGLRPTLNYAERKIDLRPATSLRFAYCGVARKRW